mmetsp:Transcript_26496/g.76477  ORF Transcript_26496/g.76477 Transcript_26496/m.76477 type:complete len:200 (-) Transcript_26496:1058-1657(-)
MDCPVRQTEKAVHGREAQASGTQTPTAPSGTARRAGSDRPGRSVGPDQDDRRERGANEGAGGCRLRRGGCPPGQSGRADCQPTQEREHSDAHQGTSGGSAVRGNWAGIASQGVLRNGPIPGPGGTGGRNGSRGPGHDGIRQTGERRLQPREWGIRNAYHRWGGAVHQPPAGGRVHRLVDEAHAPAVGGRDGRCAGPFVG